VKKKKKKTRTYCGLTKYQHTMLRKILHQIIRKRDGRCLKCGKVSWLHASHIYPKGRYPAMQYNPENVKALCMPCHLHWWHKAPIEAGEWVKTAIKKKRLTQLHEESLSGLRAIFVYKEEKAKLNEYLERFC